MQIEHALTWTKRGALMLMVPLGIETFYYTGRGLYRAARFCFLQPDRWNNHQLVDPEVVITLGPRIAYFVCWAGIILASTVVMIAGLYLLNRIRRGLIFDEISARGLKWVGGSLAVALILDQVFQAFDRYLITMSNIDGPLPVRWFYDPSDFKSISIGFILLLLGEVMRRGIQAQRENQEYI